MDRFIDNHNKDRDKTNTNLKSNMDRFIVLLDCLSRYRAFKFKIQYGQIYR